MILKEQIRTVFVSLKVDDKVRLFVLLCADGTVNRQGRGSAEDFDGNLYIGKAQEPLFQHFMSNVNDEIFAHAGVYNVPNQKGKTCELKLLFGTEEGETGFEFNYGSESQGPPEDINNLIREAVRLTEPWFQQQKGIAKKSQNPPESHISKSKWQFWKRR